MKINKESWFHSNMFREKIFFHASGRNILITFSILMLFVILAGCGSPNTGSATLMWDKPSVNEDGTPLTDLGGFNVYYGTSSASYTNSVNVGNATGAVINDLYFGRWCFAVTAYDNAGNESDRSAKVCKKI
jgi:hypothetical protein